MAAATQQQQSKITLYYFSRIPGRGDISRILLKLAGAVFDEPYIESSETGNWKTLKPTTPFGQLPVLEVDGWKIPESGAIERYLARRYNFYGDGSLNDQARVDIVCEAMKDVVQPFAAFARLDKASPERIKLQTEFLTNHVPAWLPRLEAILTSNKGGWFVGDKISVADIAFFAAFRMEILSPLLAGSAVLKAHHDKIGAVPAVAKHVADRAAFLASLPTPAAAPAPAAAAAAAAAK